MFSLNKNISEKCGEGLAGSPGQMQRRPWGPQAPRAPPAGGSKPPRCPLGKVGAAPESWSSKTDSLEVSSSDVQVTPEYLCTKASGKAIEGLFLTLGP